MAAWWTCTLCGDRMRESVDPRIVERDRDAHLRKVHPGQRIEPRGLMVSWWSQTGEPVLVQV